MRAFREGRSDELQAFSDCVHEDCVFRTPTYLKPWRGREKVIFLLQTVAEVFGDSFAYHRQWLSQDGRQWALEFTAKVGEKFIKGLDLVSLDADGKVVEFEVVARPLSAVAALKAGMGLRVPAKLAALAKL